MPENDLVFTHREFLRFNNWHFFNTEIEPLACLIAGETVFNPYEYIESYQDRFYLINHCGLGPENSKLILGLLAAEESDLRRIVRKLVLMRYMQGDYQDWQRLLQTLSVNYDENGYPELHYDTTITEIQYKHKYALMSMFQHEVSILPQKSN